MLFCTKLTFDLILRLRSIFRLGIHPYMFYHTSRSTMSMDAIMYSILPPEEFFRAMDCWLCAEKTIGSQSCTNRSRICRTSNWRRSMIRLFETGRQFAFHRVKVCRFRRTPSDGLPIPFLTIFGRAPPDDLSITDYLSTRLRLKKKKTFNWKNRTSIGKLLTWSDGAPIADGRRWSADNPDNPQIIGPKTHRIGIGAFMWQRYHIKVNTCIRMCVNFPACELF